MLTSRSVVHHLLNDFIVLINFEALKLIASLNFSFQRGSYAYGDPDIVILVHSLQASHILRFFEFLFKIMLFKGRFYKYYTI